MEYASSGHSQWHSSGGIHTDWQWSVYVSGRVLLVSMILSNISYTSVLYYMCCAIILCPRHTYIEMWHSNWQGWWICDISGECPHIQCVCYPSPMNTPSYQSLWIASAMALQCVSLSEHPLKSVRERTFVWWSLIVIFTIDHSSTPMLYSSVCPLCYLL